MTSIAHPELDGIGNYEFGWSDKSDAGTNAKRGLSEDVVRDISAKKSEPQWMLDLRLKGLKLFEKKPMPTFGSDLSGIFFDQIKYFVRSTEKQAATWEDLPDEIKNLIPAIPSKTNLENTTIKNHLLGTFLTTFSKLFLKFKNVLLGFVSFKVAPPT